MRTHNGFRKYGFHGISHHYVAMEAARILNRPLDRLNAVSCHLGSGGASLCAIVAGQSVDNTMGYSPLQGLVMSTRCGDLDPSVCLQLMALNNGDVKSVEKTLNIQSGVLGLSHYTSDIRDVLKEGRTGAAQSHEEILTMQIYLWRIRKYLGAYLAVVGSTDTVIFTDTIGVTVPTIRWAICKDMEVFGVEMDADRNKNISTLPADIATPESRVRILVIATNEELAIARQSYMAFHEESEMCEKEGV